MNKVSIIAMAFVGLSMAACFDNVNTCYENQLLIEDDICDYDPDNDREDQIYYSCQEEAGYADGIGCSAEAAAALGCQKKVLEDDPDCEDINDELEENCSYEMGELQGCLDRG